MTDLKHGYEGKPGRSEAGRRGEGLVAEQEAVDLYRELVGDGPEALGLHPTR